MCLHVVGEQGVGATPVGDSHGEACQVSSGPPVFEMPSWWGRINMPVWLPDPPPDEIMNNAIVAHVNTAAKSLEAPDPGAPVVVEYGAEGAMLHVLGVRLREAVSRGAVDRHLLAVPVQVRANQFLRHLDVVVPANAQHQHRKIPRDAPRPQHGLQRLQVSAGTGRGAKTRIGAVDGR